MGGIGSGRHFQFGKATTNDFKSIDIRWLKSEGLLGPGLVRRVVWSRRGIETGSITVRAESGRLVLCYNHRENGGEWAEASYPVLLETTACHLGGERSWFKCPAQGCGRRVAVLYGGSVFACRHCHRLVYASQRENEMDRAARRAEQLRERLGWPGGIFEGSGWGKPKGMHWRTYERLSRAHDGFADMALARYEAWSLALGGKLVLA